jgi:hypothetical protein
MYHDDDLSKDVILSPRFTLRDSCSVWRQFVGFLNHLADEEPSDLRMRVTPRTANFDGFRVTLTNNQAKAVVKGPRHDGTSPRDLENKLQF